MPVRPMEVTNAMTPVLMTMIRAGWVYVLRRSVNYFVVCVVASLWNQNLEHLYIKGALSRGRRSESRAVLADVTGGNVSVCDWEKPYHKVTLSPCVGLFALPLFILRLPHNDPHYFTRLFSPCRSCVFLIRGTHRENIHLLFLSSVELRRCCVATWQALDCQGLYCGFTACWPPAQPHTHTKTHTRPAHSRTAAGGRARWQMHTSAGAGCAVLM